MLAAWQSNLPVICSFLLHWESFMSIYTITSPWMHLLLYKSHSRPSMFQKWSAWIRDTQWSCGTASVRTLFCNFTEWLFAKSYFLCTEAGAWFFWWYSTRPHFDGATVVWCFNWVRVSNDALLLRAKADGGRCFKQRPASMLHHLKYGQPHLHARQSQMKGCSAAESQSSDWDVKKSRWDPPWWLSILLWALKKNTKLWETDSSSLFFCFKLASL